MILPRGINATAGSLTTHTQPLHGATLRVSVCVCVHSLSASCARKNRPLGFYFPLVATDLLLALVNGSSDPRPKQTSN